MRNNTVPMPVELWSSLPLPKFPILSFVYQNVLTCLHLSPKWAASLSMPMQPGSHGARAYGSAGSRLGGIYLNL